MQKFYLISFSLFFTNISLCSTSLFCPYSVYPSSDSDFEKLRVEEKKKEGFISPNGEKPFRLFTRALSSECPKRGCLHELALAEPRIPGTLFLPY
ncbi:hypothetical protein Mgra_00003702 [Meloidogyne graminicola]|uniref:Uncharacterized protein n=1 Tax=Meloidogyne graminicola TaxID=189291 RepID=A0A8S9ZU86_9BILA|nr:hypothetical protein Mgra_00003702 [Meloidogyne graminicola]